METESFRPVLLTNYKSSLTSGWSFCYVSIKYDGWRMIWIPCPSSLKGGTFVTRQGKTFDAPPIMYEICRSISPHDILDGEMWKGYGCQSSDISSGCDTSKLQFMIFDCPSHRGLFHERYAYLQRLLSKNKCNNVCLVEQNLIIPSDTEFHQLMEAEVRGGGEGIVIRNPNAGYDFGSRSLNILKLKPFDIITATVVDHSEKDDATTYTKSLACTTTESEYGNLV